MGITSSNRVWARWGLLASTFTLGLALILASWANYRTARNATGALYHGQADIFQDAIRQVSRGYHPGADQPPDLQQVLTERSADGLRYIGFLDETGTIVHSAGAAAPVPLPKVDREHLGEMQMTKVGAVVRAIVVFRPRPSEGTPGNPPRPDRSDGAAASNAGPAGAESRPGRESGPRLGGIVIEFEPMIATVLMDRATRLGAFGIAAAATMMLAAVFFWRMSRRYEDALRGLERQRRLSLLGEMTAVLAHEIRNPLASLKGHAQLLAERLAGESNERRKAERVVSEASRLEALTTDLLDFARTGPLDLARVDPAQLLTACAQEVAPAGLELDLTEAPHSWVLDGRRMGQALVNLLRNALQATGPEDARPVARAFVEGDTLVVTIRDHGRGLPAGQEARVFDPFFTTRASGTGLGLAVARRVIELHGGRITAENHPQGGALFRITLPAKQG
ncbi:MAG: hypothetical protein KBD56_07215 [Candidatus Eisenbacteria bacterium]|nr:hypothetical protein [Candidatus Eisenbacteria bacterium]